MIFLFGGDTWLLTSTQFVAKAAGKDISDDTIGHGLTSYTENIRCIKILHPTDHYPVFFIDTPGFDDTYRSDTDILTAISDWLVKL